MGAEARSGVVTRRRRRGGPVDRPTANHLCELAWCGDDVVDQVPDSPLLAGRAAVEGVWTDVAEQAGQLVQAAAQHRQILTGLHRPRLALSEPHDAVKRRTYETRVAVKWLFAVDRGALAGQGVTP